MPWCNTCLTAGHRKNWLGWQGGALVVGRLLPQQSLALLNGMEESCWVLSLFLQLQTTSGKCLVLGLALLMGVMGQY